MDRGFASPIPKSGTAEPHAAVGIVKVVKPGPTRANYLRNTASRSIELVRKRRNDQEYSQHHRCQDPRMVPERHMMLEKGIEITA